MIFLEAFCERCRHEKWTHTQNDKDLKCEILSNSFLGELVPEWIYNEEGWPVCTAWEFWDWGYDDETGDLVDPPPPPDPNQLCFPFMMDEILDQEKVFQEEGVEEYEHA